MNIYPRVQKCQSPMYVNNLSGQYGRRGREREERKRAKKRASDVARGNKFQM